MSPTSSCNFFVAICAYNCPLATIIWNYDGELSFIFVRGVSNRILRKSASGMALDKAPLSTGPLMFNYPKTKRN